MLEIQTQMEGLQRYRGQMDIYNPRVEYQEDTSPINLLMLDFQTRIRRKHLTVCYLSCSVGDAWFVASLQVN